MAAVVAAEAAAAAAAEEEEALQPLLDSEGRPRAGSVRALPDGPTGRVAWVGLGRAAASVPAPGIYGTGLSAGALRPAQARQFGTATGIDKARGRATSTASWDLCEGSIVCMFTALRDAAARHLESAAYRRVVGR
jgi:hypothetical protein